MSVPNLDVAALVKLALSSLRPGQKSSGAVLVDMFVCVCVFFVFVLVGLMINGFSKILPLVTGDDQCPGSQSLVM